MGQASRLLGAYNMAGLQEYNQKIGLDNIRGAGANISQPNSVMTKLVQDDSLLNAGLNAVKVASNLIMQNYESEISTKALEATVNYKRDLNKFYDEYTSQNKGELALNASQDFASFSKKLSEDYLNKFEDNKLKQMFQRNSLGTAMRFEEMGVDYSNREKQAWQQSVLDSAIVNYENEVANNFDNAEYIEHQNILIKEQVAKMNPGMDLSGMFGKLDISTIENRASAFLARGQVKQAESLINGSKDLLGARYDENLSRIVTAKKQAEAEYKTQIAEQKNLERENMFRQADNIADNFVKRLQAGDEAVDIQKEILSIEDKDLRRFVQSAYTPWKEVIEAEAQQEYQNRVLESRDFLNNSADIHEAYNYVNLLPENTPTEVKIKKQAQRDYSAIASHVGLKGSTDPNAFSDLSELIFKGQINSEQALMSNDLAFRINKQDMKKLADDLKESSTVKTADLKTAFISAYGLTPNKKFNNKQAQDFLDFTNFATKQIKDTNRAKEENYLQDLADTFVLGAETTGSFFSVGYGKNVTFGQAINDPNTLPDLQGDEKLYIDNLFAKNVDFAKSWATKFDGNMDLAKRAYYKAYLLENIGKRK